MADQNMTPAPEATPPTGVDPTATPASTPGDGHTQAEVVDPAILAKVAQNRWEDQLYGQQQDAIENPQTTVSSGTLPPLSDPVDKAMFGLPTMRPQEPITVGSGGPHNAPPPEGLVESLHYFSAIASRPDAPPSAQALLAALMREVQG